VCSFTPFRKWCNGVSLRHSENGVMV